MTVWEKFKAFLNDQPGRKRGIAAVLLGVALGLEIFGLSDIAEALRSLNTIVQDIQVGSALLGVLLALFGWLQAFLQRRA